MRSDDTASTELSTQAAAAITAHRDQSLHEARRAAALCMVGLAIALVGVAWVRRGGGILRTPAWILLAAVAAATYEFSIMATRLNAARRDIESLARPPLRAWCRPAVLERRSEEERWLLLYATGKQAPPAPFAAVAQVGEWPVRAPALLVDVAGVPRRGRTLTVFDAATGSVVGMGPVASTAKTVQLMRPS
jgi:hypothetical protein